ncbi:MAG: GMC family oxidoreductase [Geminicoccaceae bacterium]
MECYDYIVVGGGSAGCVLANRLSADPKKRVLLLEAGPDTPPGKVPEAILDSFPSVAYFRPDWHWRDLRVHYERLGDNRPRQKVSRRYEQARIMGGGSSINGMMAIRGLPSDYDGWEAAGAAGWGFEDVLPYFKRLERDLDYCGPLHGHDGPLPIRRIREPEWPGFARAARRAMLDEGFFELDDHNGEFGDGLFPMAINNQNDQRVSTAIAYLDAVTRSRPNLGIRAGTEVESLVIDGRRVTGVVARLNGESKSFNAGEVILATGALHSPAMLLRAGIGPAAELSAMGIEVVADRPGVGRDLQDHPMVALVAHIQRGVRMPAAMRRHIHLGLRYSSGHPDCPAGDMFALANNRGGWHPLGHVLGAIIVCVNKPFTEGRITLRSASWRDEPVIDFNQFGDERDLARLTEAMKLAYRIMGSDAIRQCTHGLFPSTFSEKARDLAIVSAGNWLSTKLASLLLDLPVTRSLAMRHLISPGVDIHALMQSNAALRDWVRDNACGSWHAAGTCRMGDPDDPETVVDPDCRVLGVDGLRVVDASIMPSVVSANTNLTTIMLAEKAADHILNERKPS